MHKSPIVLFVQDDIVLNESVPGWVDVRGEEDVDLREYVLSGHNLIVGYDFPEARVGELILGFVARDKSDNRTSIVLKDGQDLANLVRWVEVHVKRLLGQGVLTQLGQSRVLFDTTLWRH